MTNNKNNKPPEEKELNNRVKKLEERIETLEQTVTKPLYEYRSSLNDPTENKKNSFNWNRSGKILLKYIIPILAIGLFISGIALTLFMHQPKTSFALGLTSIGLIAISIILFIAARLLKKDAPLWAWMCFAGATFVLFLLLYLLSYHYKLISTSIALILFIILIIASELFVKLRLNDQIPHITSQWPSLSFILFAGLTAYYAYGFYQYHANWMIIPTALFILFFLIPLFQSCIYHYRTTWWQGVLAFLSVILGFIGVCHLYATSAPLFIGCFSLPFAKKAMIASIFGIIMAILSTLITRFNKKDNIMRVVLELILYTILAFFIISSTNLLLQSIGFLILGNFLFAVGLRTQDITPRILGYASWIYGALSLISVHILKHYFTFDYRLSRLAFIMWIIFMTTSYIRAYHNQKKLNATEQKIVPSLLLITALIIPLYWIFMELLPFVPLSIIPIPLYALGIYLIGLKKNNSLLRHCAYWIYALGLFIFAFYYKYYHLLHPYWGIELSLLFSSFLLPLILIFIIRKHIRQSIGPKEYELTINLALLGTLFFIFCWASALTIMQFDHLTKPGSIFLRPFFEYSMKDSTLIRSTLTEYILTFYASLFAFIFLLIGLKRRQQMFRIMGVFFIVLAILKLLGIIANKSPGYPILFIIIGIFLCAGFGLYYRKHRKSSK